MPDEVHFPVGRPVTLVRPSGLSMAEQVEIGAMLKPCRSTLLVTCSSVPDRELVAEIAECANALFVSQLVLLCVGTEPQWFAALKRFEEHGKRFRIVPMMPTARLLACAPLGLADAEGRLLNTIFYLHRLAVKASWRASAYGEAHGFTVFANDLLARTKNIYPSMTLEEAVTFADSRTAA